MVGQNIGKYRVLDRVGRGGMGTVFRALDETLSREVAIKILNAELNDPEVARRFRAEAVTVARLNHPGIATIYELFQHDGQWLMVMEFVRGETLEHMVERLGPLSPQRAADLCMQTLAALSHAHRMGVVHRDLKPANLMITESGAVKIMDFGIARVAGSEHLTSAGFLMGTPAYMAPEQVTGGEIDARTDLYAIGVVFYYLITARLPFKGDTPIAMAQSRISSTPTPVNSVREGLPTWIGPLSERSLAKDPADRFQTADQFRESLRRGLAGLPMETLSGASIPPELIATTPPGVLQAPTSGSLSGASASGAVSGTISGSMPPSSASSSASSVAMKGPTAASAAPVATPPSSAPSAKTPASTPPAKTYGRRATDATKSSGVSPVVLALGAAVVVLAVLVGWMLLRSRPPAPGPSTAVTNTAAATPSPTPVATPDPNAATSLTPAASPTTSPVGAPPAALASSTPTAAPNRSGAPIATPTPGAPPAGAPNASPSPTPGTTTAGASATGAVPTPSPGAGRSITPSPGGTRGPTAADDSVTFSDVKYFHINGTKGDDEDVNLHFGNGQILITPKKTGPALASEPYRRLAHATYVRAKNPKWDQGLPGPDPALDLSNLFRNARHWLVLQTRSDYIVLRLDDSNFQSVLDMFETRTGLKIDRSAGEK